MTLQRHEFPNIPRKDKVAKRAFIPKLDALLYFDYRQIEFLLLAFYCAKLGDESMVEALNAGKDLHEESARTALGLAESKELTDAERQVGKTLNYSLIYGGGRPTIKRQLGVSWEESGYLLGGFHRRWPGIAVVTSTINDTIADRGYIKTLWGRHLHPDSPHKALNALIQGCAADLLKAALVKTDRWIKETELVSHIVSAVHDEQQLDVWLPEVDMIVDNVPGLMDHAPISEVIQIGVDVDWTTTNWAEKETFERRTEHGERV